MKEPALSPSKFIFSMVWYVLFVEYYSFILVCTGSPVIVSWGTGFRGTDEEAVSVGEEV